MAKFNSLGAVRLFENVLEGSIDDGNVKGVENSLSMLHECYIVLREEDDYSHGQALGHHLYLEELGKTVFDVSRELYGERARECSFKSEFYNDCVLRAKGEYGDGNFY